MSKISLLPFPLGKRWNSQQEALRHCTYEYLEKVLLPKNAIKISDDGMPLDIEYLYKILIEKTEILSIEPKNIWGLKHKWDSLENLEKNYSAPDIIAADTMGIILNWTQILVGYFDYFGPMKMKGLDGKSIRKNIVFPIASKKDAVNLWAGTDLFTEPLRIPQSFFVKTLLLFPPEGKNVFNILPKEFTTDIYAAFFDFHLSTLGEFKNSMRAILNKDRRTVEILNQGSSFINEIVLKDFGTEINLMNESETWWENRNKQH
tara:strand:- start:80 stop:862 length:783 start_codon:yes stop_codon:yes gene_type:complete